MDWFSIVYFLSEWFADAQSHFWLAFFMGLLGWGLTWITLSAVYWVLRRLTRWQGSTVVGFSINFLSLLAGLALVSWSHAVLDLYVTWYTTPLGPPLELIVR